MIYLCFDNYDIKVENLELYEILGSWNDWKESFRLNDYDFIVSDNLYIYIIETNLINLSYKIRLYNTNEYILLDKLLVHDEIDGYKNNKIITTDDGYNFNGKYKIKNRNNKLEIFNVINNILLLETESKLGLPNGYGKEYDMYGNKLYKGFFKNGLYHKNGTQYSLGNKYYKGDLSNGFYNGWGILYHNNGFYNYEGLFINRSFMYKGTKYHKNGNKEYEGTFVQNDNYDIGIEYDINENKIKEGKWSNIFIKNF
jgi:hypothetical protein